MPALHDDDLINADQLAKILGVSRHYVYRLVQRDNLPHVRISRKCIRFRRADVGSWLLSKHAERAEAVS